MGIAGFGDQADRPKGKDVVEKGDLVSRFWCLSKDLQSEFRQPFGYVGLVVIVFRIRLGIIIGGVSFSLRAFPFVLQIGSLKLTIGECFGLLVLNLATVSFHSIYIEN